MVIATPSHSQQELVGLRFTPHGVGFSLVHRAPLWTSATLPMLLLWVPVAAAVSQLWTPEVAQLVSMPLALLNLSIVGAFWLRDGQLTQWRVEADAHRIRLLDGERVRLDAPYATLRVTRKGRALTLRGERSSAVELQGHGDIAEDTVAWLEQLLSDLRAHAERAHTAVDPVQRARMLAMAERASHG